MTTTLTSPARLSPKNINYLFFNYYFRRMRLSAALCRDAVLKLARSLQITRARHKFSHRATGHRDDRPPRERSRSRREQDKQGQTSLG